MAKKIQKVKVRGRGKGNKMRVWEMEDETQRYVMREGERRRMEEDNKMQIVEKKIINLATWRAIGGGKENHFK